MVFKVSLIVKLNLHSPSTLLFPHSFLEHINATGIAFF